MATRTIPTLQALLSRLVSTASAEHLSGPPAEKPGRFPVVVRPETRAFLEAQASYLGGSIAGIAGAILDGVAMSTAPRHATATEELKGIGERFSLLLQEHGLTVPGAVDALADLGFTLSDFATSEALLLRMNSKTLRGVAERFHVRYEWLAGVETHPGDTHGAYWYKNSNGAARQLLQAAEFQRSEFILLSHEDANFANLDDDNWEKSAHITPVIAHTSLLDGGEELTTYQVWEECRWTYRPCRDYLKLAVYFARELGSLSRKIHVVGKLVSRSDYQALREGSGMAASIVGRGRVRGTWYPDDYVSPDSRVAKGLDEWHAIQSNYREEWNKLEALLSEFARAQGFAEFPQD
jgi:hypothetical protein